MSSPWASEFRGMTPDEQRRAWREQAISLAWLKLSSMRHGSRVTRQQVVELFDARDELLASQGREA